VKVEETKTSTTTIVKAFTFTWIEFEGLLVRHLQEKGLLPSNVMIGQIESYADDTQLEELRIVYTSKLTVNIGEGK
jgi:hypothetical protein